MKNILSVECAKKALFMVVGVLAIMLSGFILALLMSLIPIGYSDAEIETIGRMYYRGLPWPYYVADGVSIMHGFGMWLERFPINAVFWTVVVAFLSCIPRRRMNWRRVVVTALLALAIYGAYYVYLFGESFGQF